MLSRVDPAVTVTFERLVLARQVDTALALGVAPLREGTCAGAELRGYGSVLLDPVGEGVFAVLDDTRGDGQKGLTW